MITIIICIMLLSFILGLVIVVVSIKRRKEHNIYKESIVVGAVLIIFAIYLGWPK
ncbi:hypothetical protein [Mammaliicoccus sciuri]|uniref:hypothetical protein n=1 Tax=Mammaliicoccus sciuri TaxID=1296 RepID=UPI003F55BADB